VFVVLFVVLLSAVVYHGDMKRKGNRDASRRGEVKHEFVPARVPFQVFQYQNILKVRIWYAIS
jgi:hypothetical protein